MPELICRYCQESFSHILGLESHFRSSHKDIFEKEKNKIIQPLKTKTKKAASKTFPLSKSANKKNKKEAAKAKKASKYKEIEIFSNRSTKFDGLTKCSSCSLSYNSVWRFAKTSVGIAYLCSGCKNRICKPASWTSVLYNSVESNRRRH